MIIPSKETIEIFKSTKGAFSVAEMIALYNVLLDAPRGVYGELGTHKGKSAIPMVAAMRGNEIVLVEPEFKDEQWLKETIDNIQKAARANLFCLPIAAYSTDVLPDLGDFAYILLDSGDHGEELVQAEIKVLKDKVIHGGIIAFHDFGNQFTAVARGYEWLIQTGLYEPINIDWPPILEYVAKNNLEEGNNSWHLYPELSHSPNFVGALRRK